jgi:hypothetical protein
MSTPPADLRSLPSQLDISTLMRQVLAERPGEDEVDAALRRITQREFPHAKDGLFAILERLLSAQQRMLGIGRLEAVTRLAQAKSEMRISPDGEPEITSFQVQAAGLERLSSAQRERVLEELETAVRTGKSVPTEVFLRPEPNAERSPWAFLAIVAVVISLAALYVVGYLLGRQ